MNKRYLAMSSRIKAEFDELDQVVARVLSAWRRAASTGDNAYIDSVALHLHGLCRMAPLVTDLPDVYAQAKADILRFTSALEQRVLDQS